VLRAWFLHNGQRFALPARMSFRHVYFSLDRGTSAREAALAGLHKLGTMPPDRAAWAGLGDRFMFLDYYGDRTPDQVASVFGTAFAAALFTLRADGSWHGPVESGFGWHLVWVDSAVPGQVPPFEEVETSVKQEWMADQRDTLKQKAFEAMRARYTVVVGPAVNQMTSTAAQTSAASGEAAPQ
jgi:peptidyl-prolyl cis-trans isomerase C